MDEQAKKLAEAFLASGKPGAEFQYSVTGTAQNIRINIVKSTDDEMQKLAKIEKLSKRIYEVSQYPSGQTCPACGGSGRI